MVVVMQHQLPHIVDIEVLFLLVFHCLTEEKWDVYQVVPIDGAGLLAIFPTQIYRSG